MLSFSLTESSYYINPQPPREQTSGAVVFLGLISLVHNSAISLLLSGSSIAPPITGMDVLRVSCIITAVIVGVSIFAIRSGRYQKKRRALLVDQLKRLGLEPEVPPKLSTRSRVSKSLLDLGNNWSLLPITFGILGQRPIKRSASASEIHFYASGTPTGRRLEFIEVLPTPRRGGNPAFTYTFLLINPVADMADAAPTEFWCNDKAVSTIMLDNGDSAEIFLCGQNGMKYVACGAWLSAADVEAFVAVADQA